MRIIIAFSLFSFLLFSISCTPATQENSELTPTEEETSSEDNSYDAALAEKLGADDYGMKSYVFAFLKTGPNRTQDSVKAAELQAAHMANIGRLAEAGKLILAGPFIDGNETFRGIYIFNTSSVEEARALTESDPAIQAGSLVMELHPWYGTASLQLLNDMHPKAAKLSF